MKTVLVLTNSTETRQLLTEILGESVNVVALTAPTEPGRAKFDALLATWSSLMDAVVLDAVSLKESSRWALEALNAARLAEHQAVVVRATSVQKTVYPMNANWLCVSETDTTEQLKQSLLTFLQLRSTEARLQRATDIGRQQRHAPAPAVMPAADSYRYRDALKTLSNVLGQQLDEPALLNEFLRLVRELLGVGKAGIFVQSAPRQFSVGSSKGISEQVVEYFRLTLDAGIGAWLAKEARALRRTQVADLDEQSMREFEVMGTEVVVPMFDDDVLIGVLTMGGKIAGEAWANDELELAYYLMSQLAQAIRHRRLHEELTGHQQLISEVLANVQSGVVVAGQDEKILHVNAFARQLLGLGEEQLEEKRLSILPGRVADVIFEAIRSGEPIQNAEVTLPRENRPLSVSVTRFAAQPGAVFVALISDLTQYRLQEEQARDEADKEFLSRLAYRLSDELRNSLVSIKTYAQLLPEQHDEKEFRERFSVVVNNEIKRIEMLLNNLKFFSQPLSLGQEEVRVADLIETCVKNVAADFAKKKMLQVLLVGEKSSPDSADIPVVVFKKNFAQTVGCIQADRVRLTQAFEQVIRNALQAMPRGGRLSVSTSEATAADVTEGRLPEGGAVRIEWHDSGEGIPLEDLPRVTEPFVTSRHVGVGLGLTIVKKIVERHCGRLDVDSVLGRGTTVVMVLPVKMQPHPDDALLLSLAGAGAKPVIDAGAAVHHAASKI